MSAGNTVFSICSFLTFIVVSVPLCWHIEAWNAGMCLYIAWTSLGNLVYFVNSVIWNGNTTNWAPVWCDISTKFMVGLTIGLPAASLCINRRLHKMAVIRKVVTTKAEKRRDVLIDLCIGVGIPIIVMALHYIPQGHRFDIFEDIGCMPVIHNTWVAFLVTQVPIIIVTGISGAYSIASVVAFKRREIELRVFLSSTSTPSPNRYLRLMCLAGIDVVLTCFVVSAGIIYSVNTGFQPWISWADTHSSFSRVGEQPAIIWRSDPNSLTMLELPRWVVVVYGLLFFAFFGLAQEARKYYCKVYIAIMHCLGFRMGKNLDVRKGLPTVMQKDECTSTRNSVDTFIYEIGGVPTTTACSPKPTSKEFLPPPSLDSVEMPVLHDLSTFLLHESSPETAAASFPTETSPDFSQNQVSFSDDMSMLVLQDVSGFLQADSRLSTRAMTSANKCKVPIGPTCSPIIPPNINTPPRHRPHSFPVSMTSHTSSPPQIIILPPPQTPVAPHSSASSESMYSTSTATDVSPQGGLFPFPLLPSSPPSRTLGAHPLSASFLDLETPKASSFLDFDDPPSEFRTRGRLAR